MVAVFMLKQFVYPCLYNHNKIKIFLNKTNNITCNKIV